MQHSRPWRSAIVTGASSGIGRATAAMLSRSGYRVFGTSRHEGAPLPDNVEPLVLDVRDDASVAACVAAAVKAAGRIDLLVNNAGLTLLGAVEETAPEDAENLFAVNVMGVHRMTRAVLPHMRAAGGGRIVVIGSIAGFLPKPFEAMYAASKHALEGYVETLDHEVRGFGVRAVLIQPGFMRTGLGANAVRSSHPLPEYNEAVTRVHRLLERDIAGGADPAEVAAAVVQAATSPKPKARILIGRDARRLHCLRGLMPHALFDNAVRRRFQLDRVS